MGSLAGRPSEGQDRQPSCLRRGQRSPQGHGCLRTAARKHSPIKGQFVALEEVGVIVGPQRSLAFAVAAGHFLHFAVGTEQALLACPGLGPPTPEGSEEPMAPLTQVSREEGVQLLPVEEGKQMLGRLGLARGDKVLRVQARSWGGPGQRRPETPLLPS